MNYHEVNFSELQYEANKYLRRIVSRRMLAPSPPLVAGADLWLLPPGLNHEIRLIIVKKTLCSVFYWFSYLQYIVNWCNFCLRLLSFWHHNAETDLKKKKKHERTRDGWALVCSESAALARGSRVNSLDLKKTMIGMVVYCKWFTIWNQAYWTYFNITVTSLLFIGNHQSHG